MSDANDLQSRLENGESRTLVVTPGTYVFDNEVDQSASGVTVVASAPGVVLRGRIRVGGTASFHGVTLQGGGDSAVFEVDGTLVVTDSDVSGADNSCILMQAASARVEIRRSKVHDCGTNAVSLRSDFVIENSVFYDNGALAGINLNNSFAVSLDSLPLATSRFAHNTVALGFLRSRSDGDATHARHAGKPCGKTALTRH